ncbi:thermonuclease family protein [Phenylobacterium sp. LjRoot225]|uniref:thermonuclease family protein n=1 Tax=Phenylobacterium sp. LjRoot225 TaxID=3342285 RepID=UPI003ECFD787
MARGAVAGLAVAILAVAGHATPGHGQPRREPQEIVGRADVIDGDTFRIGRQSIRIWGIDAPDDDRKAFGTRALRQIVRAPVLTCRPLGRSYQRIVARCVDERGRDIAWQMVETGWALDWPRFSRGFYRPAEARARARRAGVFGTDQPLWRDLD